MAKVFSIHMLSLKEDVNAEDFERFVVEEWYPNFVPPQGASGYLLKGTKGDRQGRYLWTWEYESVEAAENAKNEEVWRKPSGIDLWLEDGVQMPPDAAPNVGREAVSANIVGLLGMFSFEDFVINNEEITVSGDLAVVRGTDLTNLLPAGDGDSLPVDGKYMSVLKRQADGDWKLYRDIFNSNVP